MSGPQAACTIDRRQLADQVIEALERLIDNEFVAGTKLPPEAELMARFGVGRSTLREAVRALAHVGTLEVRQGDGAYVRATGPAAEPLAQRLRRARVAEVYEVRRLLELEIAPLAAARRHERDLVRMHAAHDQRGALLVAGDMQGYLDVDVEFHVAVAAATGNGVLADLYRAFAVALREALGEVVALPDHPQDEAAALHDALADAIARGDAAAAVAATERHLTLTAAEVGALLAVDPRETSGSAAGPGGRR